jgi:hypothetical protein
MKWLVVLVMLCGRAAADPAAVRKLLDERRQQLHIAGLAYAVVLDDRVVALDGLGRRDPARTLPATRFSDFRTSDGEIVPWRWTTHDALGDKTVRVDRIEWNVALPAGSFAPVAHLTR